MLTIVDKQKPKSRFEGEGKEPSLCVFIREAIQHRTELQTVLLGITSIRPSVVAIIKEYADIPVERALNEQFMHEYYESHDLGDGLSRAEEEALKLLCSSRATTGVRMLFSPPTTLSTAFLENYACMERRILGTAFQVCRADYPPPTTFHSFPEINSVWLDRVFCCPTSRLPENSHVFIEDHHTKLAVYMKKEFHADLLEFKSHVPDTDVLLVVNWHKMNLYRRMLVARTVMPTTTANREHFAMCGVRLLFELLFPGRWILM